MATVVELREVPRDTYGYPRENCKLNKLLLKHASQIAMVVEEWIRSPSCLSEVYARWVMLDLDYALSNAKSWNIDWTEFTSPELCKALNADSLPQYLIDNYGGEL